MEKKLRVIIIDDEPDAVASIELIVKEFCQKLEIVASANLIDHGWELIREHDPNLILLDVDMPRGSGFDLLERFPIRKFGVIFITAYSKYERRAEQYGAFDYLHKPIDIDHFNTVIERFVKHREQNPNEIFRLVM